MGEVDQEGQGIPIHEDLKEQIKQTFGSTLSLPIAEVTSCHHFQS